MYLILWKCIRQTLAQTREFLGNWGIPAKEVKPFGRRRLLLTYNTIEDREKALCILKDKMVRKRPLIVEKFEKDRSIMRRLAKSKKWKSSFVNKSTQTQALIQVCLPTTAQIHLGLYTLNRNLRPPMTAAERVTEFDKAPPNYLKYMYPPLNPSILQGISVALSKNSVFYTQVLHLMNRMNLDPPFGINATPFEDLVKDAQIQTEKESPEKCRVCSKKKRRRLLPPSESEWATSDEEVKVKQPASSTTNTGLTRKRKHYTEEQLQKKAKYRLESYRRPIIEPQTSSNSGGSTPAKIICKSRILPPKIDVCINLASKTSEEVIDDKNKKQENDYNNEINVNVHSSHQLPTDVRPFESSDSLPGQRLSQETMDTLPVFKNYDKGIPTNKLYIKNLHKNVVENDLLDLYKGLLKANELNVQSEEEINNRIQVHLMQHGRMKGQAFVTFFETDLKIVEKALQSTNGLVLKEKPMVVYYCKQQQQQQQQPEEEINMQQQQEQLQILPEQQ